MKTIFRLSKVARFPFGVGFAFSSHLDFKYTRSAKYLNSERITNDIITATVEMLLSTNSR